LYNYFKNIFDLYQKIGVQVPLEFCPKSYARAKIIEYVQKEYAKGRFVGIKELCSLLCIKLSTYFKSMEDLYSKSGIDLELYRKSLFDRSDKTYSDEKNEENKKRIKRLIRKSVDLGFYPSTSLIQKRLNLKFYKYFKNIQEAYKEANVVYDRPCPTILGKKKEEVLTEIAIKLLENMNYKVKRVSIYEALS